MRKYIPLLLILLLSCATTSNAKFISLNEWDPAHRYSLTLSSDSKKVLDMKHSKLKLEEFGTGSGQSPEDVGSDEGRKFTFTFYGSFVLQLPISHQIQGLIRFPSLESWLNGNEVQKSYFIYSVGGGGEGGWVHRHKKKLVSRGAREWDNKHLRNYAEIHWDPSGEAVKLSAKGLWVDDRGKTTSKEDKAALFRLTKLT